MIRILYVLLLIIFLILSCCTPRQNLKKYEHLTNPEIRNIPKQKVIAVHTIGDPNVTGEGAFKALFKTLYKLKKAEFSAPRARWPKPINTSKDEYVGIYGLPIPEEVNRLPIQREKNKVQIEYWEYGDIAEILHIGKYSDETETIDKLKKYVDEKGYKIIEGSHEEEYLKGPGMFFKGNSEKYQTIIRYRIEKK